MVQNNVRSLTQLVCISDTHSSYDFPLPSGDILIHAGDLTRTGGHKEMEKVVHWLKTLSQYRLKIIIAGNHDVTLDEEFYQRNWKRFHTNYQNSEQIQMLVRDPILENDYGIIYLQDRAFIDPQTQLKFYGSPWQPAFCSWAFNVPRNSERLHELWQKIPLDTDVLITHGPPYGILDSNNSHVHVGCQALLERVRIIRPKLHVFGHIHESYGKQQNDESPTIFVNASTCNIQYQPIQLPIVVDL